MSINKVKLFLESKLSILVFIFVILQPILDVFSYFLSERGSNSISTFLRFFVLALLTLLGFVVSDKKRTYYIFYGIIIGFYIIHTLNCFRTGYISFFDDTANYMRIVTLPMYALSFMTFFQKGKQMRKVIYSSIAINFGLIILFTILPWALNQPVFTYESLNVGVMGWFKVRNAQSGIIALLTPLTLLFAYKTKKIFVFAITSIATFGLMFLTGTKLTYYAIFLIAAGFILLFVLNLKKKAAPYLLILVTILGLTVGFKSRSPMSLRDQMTGYSQGEYIKRVDANMTSSVKNKEDQATIDSIKAGNVKEKAREEAKDKGKDHQNNKPNQTFLLERVRKSLWAVYTSKNIYGVVLKDVNSRFGVYNVMEAYEYTAEPITLSDTREKKNVFAKLVWEEKDFLTKLFGYEYSEMIYGDTIFDLENDFPAIYYFCGYLGFALYILFFLYFIIILLRSFLTDIKHFLTIEMGVIGMSFILAIGAAQISGNILRRPNVTAYFGIIIAYIYYLCAVRWKEKKDLEGDNMKSSEAPEED